MIIPFSKFLLIFIAANLFVSCSHWTKDEDLSPAKEAAKNEIILPPHVQETSAGFIFPLDEYRLSGKGKFVWRKHRMHKGVDLLAPKGTPIRAMNNGTVAFSGVSRGYGKRVVIDHGEGLTSIYAHNTENVVAVGEKVQRGQIIAYVGRTGRASANHLHFEIRIDKQEINPLLYITSGQIEGAPAKKKTSMAKSSKKKKGKDKGAYAKNKKKKSKKKTI